MKTNQKIKLLCISRRYYPSLGGMSTFCSAIFPRINQEDFDVTMLVLGKSQVHLLWFFPYVIFYIICNARKYDAIFVGDLLMCLAGNVCKKFSPQTKRLVAVHGLDITYANSIYQWYIRKFAKNSFDIYVCNSDATKQLLTNRGIYKAITVPSGVDKERYKGLKRDKALFLTKYGYSEDKDIILTAGRLVKRKGVNWFVRNVVPCLPESALYLIVGNGPDYELVKQTIHEKHLEKKVRMITDVSDDELNMCYLNADVFVMPNIRVENDMEGFGLVAIEASLAGNMVIAADVDGISTAVIEGKNGYLVESRNAEAFLEKIELVLNQKNKEKLRERVIFFTKEKFDWRNVVKQYEDAVKSMF